MKTFESLRQFHILVRLQLMQLSTEFDFYALFEKMKAQLYPQIKFMTLNFEKNA